MTIVLEVPMVPPSPNVIKRKYRDPKVYASLRKTWQNSLFISTGSATMAQKWMNVAQRTEKVDVAIHICHPGSYDPDNLSASTKVCLDALVNIGFLKNDRERDINLSVTQSKDRPSGTRVILSSG
jgi:hypothetical protein